MVLFTVQPYHLLHDILFLLPFLLYLIHIDNLSDLVVTNRIALVYTNRVLFVNLFCFHFPLPINMFLSASYKGYGLQNLNSCPVLHICIQNVIYINISVLLTQCYHFSKLYSKTSCIIEFSVVHCLYINEFCKLFLLF